MAESPCQDTSVEMSLADMKVAGMNEPFSHWTALVVLEIMLYSASILAPYSQNQEKDLLIWCGCSFESIQ